jgi:hypothetical protein
MFETRFIMACHQVVRGVRVAAEKALVPVVRNC